MTRPIKRVAHLAAWVAMLPELDGHKEWLGVAEQDMAELKDLVSTSDGAWRLAKEMERIGVDPDDIPGLINRSKA